MSCDMDRRFYDEDNDTGYTITAKEALRYSQVFKDDGTPNEPSGMQAPSDANDLRQVFFLRSELDLNGAETFKHISFLGDIDKDFMGPDSVVNLAYTALNTMRKEDREEISKRLSVGQKVVDRLANPVDITDATDNAVLEGLVTWEGLQIAAASDSAIADYVRAINELVSHMELLFGGQRNLFLNPRNALPGGGNADSVRVFYENVVMPDLVPLFSVNYQDVAADAAIVGPLKEVVQNFLGGVLQPGPDDAKIADKVSKGAIPDAASAAAFYANVNAIVTRAVGSNVIDDIRRAVSDIIQLFRKNPQFTKAASVNGLNTWLEQMNAAAERAVTLIRQQTAAGNQGRQRNGAGVRTNRAVRRGSPFLTNNNRGLKPASVWNANVPADEYTVSVGGNEVRALGSRADFNLLETPIMQGLIAAQNAQGSQMGAINSQFGSQFGVSGVPHSSRQDIGLAAYDDDYVDPSGPNADVGAMFGRGDGDHELDQAAVDRL
jgi:hypothetical protein